MQEAEPFSFQYLQLLLRREVKMGGLLYVTEGMRSVKGFLKLHMAQAFNVVSASPQLPPRAKQLLHSWGLGCSRFSYHTILAHIVPPISPSSRLPSCNVRPIAKFSKTARPRSITTNAVGIRPKLPSPASYSKFRAWRLTRLASCFAIGRRLCLPLSAHLPLSPPTTQVDPDRCRAPPKARMQTADRSAAQGTRPAGAVLGNT
jgi:hypothetical protein